MATFRQTLSADNLEAVSSDKSAPSSEKPQKENKPNDSQQTTPTNSKLQSRTTFFRCNSLAFLTGGVSHNNSLSLIIFALELHKRKTRKTLKNSNCDNSRLPTRAEHEKLNNVD